GMQNRSPMVTTASPHQIVADGSADCGDSGLPGNPGVNIADFPVKAIHTIGVGAFGAEWITLLATIASETGGLNHVTNTPDEDLEDFFLDNLVQTLRVDPVEKAATRNGSLASGQENKIEPFDIDGTARKATFAVSWRGDRRVGAVGYDLIAPNGAIPHAGTWKLRFRPHLQAPKVDYRITLIVDEADIRYNFEVPTNSRGV